MKYTAGATLANDVFLSLREQVFSVLGAVLVSPNRYVIAVPERTCTAAYTARSRIRDFS